MANDIQYSKFISPVDQEVFGAKVRVVWGDWEWSRAVALAQAEQHVAWEDVSREEAIARCMALEGALRELMKRFELTLKDTP